MELKVDIGFDKLLELVSQLSEEEKIKLLNELEKTLSQPGKDTRKRGGFGILKGKVWMADDFNEPLEDFKEYM